MDVNLLVDSTAQAVCKLRKSLLNLHLSPEGQDQCRALLERIMDFQLALGEIRDLVELELSAK